jgi:hypothetical protein
LICLVGGSSGHAAPWLTGRTALRFPKLAAVAMVESRIERADRIETERRSYICSRVLSAEAFADAVRA